MKSVIERSVTESEREFWAIVSALGRPASFLDVGCGSGLWVRAAYHIGARPSLGIGTWEDKLNATRLYGRSRIITLAVNEPFQLDCSLVCRFQLVVALRSPVLPGNLTAHVLPGGRIVINDRAECELDLELDDRMTQRLRGALGSISYKVYYGA